MSANHRACPKCRQTLLISQQLPAKIKCPKCAAVFTVTGAPSKANTAVGTGAPPASSAQSVTSVQPFPAGGGIVTNLPSYRRRSSSSSGMWILLGLGGLVVVAAGCVLLFVYGGSLFSGNTTEQANNKIDVLPGSGGDKVSGIDAAPNSGKKFIDKDKQQVILAVKKGVNYLKKKLLETRGKLFYHRRPNDDPHVGAAALAGMTLLECGVPPNDPAVQQAIELVELQNKKMTFTYTLAISILFLDRLIEHKSVPMADKAKYQEIVRHLGLQLVGNQHITGGWNYSTQLLTKKDEQVLQQKLRNPKFQPAGFKPPINNNVYRDNSISQFVILALWTARKHGVSVERTLLFEEAEFKKDQYDDGSWTYSRRNEQARDATTCAGLIALAIGHAVRIEKAENAAKKKGKGAAADIKKINLIKDDENIRMGLNYLTAKTPLGKNQIISKALKEKRSAATAQMEDLYQQYYLKSKRIADIEESDPNNKELRLLKKELQLVSDDIDRLDKESRDLYNGMIFGADAWGDLYFLWSVERVAVIYGLDKINGIDWYNWGKKYILENQSEDGSWKERFPGVPDTCFALLFLKRANIVKDLSDKLDLLLAAAGVGNNPRPTPGFPVSKET